MKARIRAYLARGWTVVLVETREPGAIERLWQRVGRPMRATVDEDGRVVVIMETEGI